MPATPPSKPRNPRDSRRIWLLVFGLLVVGLGAAAVMSRRHQPRPDGPGAVSESAVVTDRAGPTDGELASTDAVIPTNRSSNWREVDDPARDGWNSEVTAEQVSQQLNRIGTFLFGDQTLDSLADLGAADFHGSSLVPAPEALTRVYQTPQLQVDRLSIEKAESELRTVHFQGAAGFQAALRPMADAWKPLNEKRFEFKLVSVRELADSVETKQFMAASGTSADEVLEQHATWVTRWVRGASKELQLQSIDVVSFEQTRASGKLFVECTPSILNANECYESQFLFGLNYWLERIQDMRYFAPLGTPGLATADVNGDGLDDLYVCQEANLPNRLFLQQPDGTARDVSAEWQVDFLEGSRSALLVDLDNDGDQDLAVAIMGGLVIASNEEDHFVVREVLETNDDTTTLTAADYDLDGDLDLYICVDYPNEYFAAVEDAEADGILVQGGAANRVYHDANNAGANSLFRNDISSSNEWRFVDVTVESGIDENNRRFTWSACWEDYDNDGDQDLYVANDFGRNNLYRNDQGHFTDVAKLTQVEDSAAGMSASWGDVDRDGNMDIHVANMFSSAGSRITMQPEFKQGVDDDLKSRWRQFAAGNTLFRNLGEDKFQNTSEAAGVTLGRWSWSSNFLDVNNDGWQDLAVANGYITSGDTGDL